MADVDDAYRKGYEAGYQACRRTKNRVTDELTKVDMHELVNEIRELRSIAAEVVDILRLAAKSNHW